MSMTPSELRTRYAQLNKEQDDKLEELERQVSSEYRQKRRALFHGQERAAIDAELEEAYYDLFPPRSEVPEGTPLVEIE